MIIFRSINNIALVYFGPLFFAIPIIIYGILKYKTHKETLQEGSASFERRALAIFFDIGLLYVVEIGMFQTLSRINNPPPLPINLIIIAVSLINMIILPSKTGWSLGKRIFGIIIVKKGNKKAGFFDIFYREIIKSWFSLPLFYFGCFWMLIGKSKLTWHDSVADTRVLNMAYSEQLNMQTHELGVQDDAPFKL